MIRVEIFERKGAQLYKTLVGDMRSGELRTFTAKDRGRTVQHTRYPGRLKWSPGEGVISGSVRAPGPAGSEWQLLSAFVGRLSHRYGDRIHSINIEFPVSARAKPARKRKKAARRKR